MLKYLTIGLLSVGVWTAAADDTPFGAASVVVYKFGQNRIASDIIQYPQETTAYEQPCHSSYQSQPKDMYTEPEYKHSPEHSEYHSRCTSEHYPQETTAYEQPYHSSYQPQPMSDYKGAYAEPEYKHSHCTSEHYPQETTAYEQPYNSSYQPQPQPDYRDVYAEPEYKHSHCTSEHYPQETTAYEQPYRSSYQPQPQPDYKDAYAEPEYKHSSEPGEYHTHCTSEHYPQEDAYEPEAHSKDYNYREPQYKHDYPDTYAEPKYADSGKSSALHIGPDPNDPLAPYLLPTDHASYSSSSDTSNIYAELKDARIIPDVLPSSFTPQFDITIRFNNEAVEMGQMLTIDETKTEPIIEFDAPYGQIFTIAIVDPDAPSNTKHGYRSFRHFLISNLGSDNAGDKLTAYRGPAPSYGSGTHRYVVLVFKQQDYIDVDPPHSRVRFDPVKWGAQHHMKPVAASYFTVKRNRVFE